MGPQELRIVGGEPNRRDDGPGGGWNIRQRRRWQGDERVGCWRRLLGQGLELQRRRHTRCPAPFEDRHEIAADTTDPRGRSTDNDRAEDGGDGRAPAAACKPREEKQPDCQKQQGGETNCVGEDDPILSFALGQPDPAKRDRAGQHDDRASPPADASDAWARRGALLHGPSL